MRNFLTVATLALMPGAASAFDLSVLQNELRTSFPETSARPLFSEDRLPPYRASEEPEIAEIVNVHAAPRLPDFDEMTFLVSGVVQTGNRRIAMTGEVFRVSEGDITLPGQEPGKNIQVKVVEISSGFVTLQGKDGFAVRLSVRDPYAPEIIELATDTATKDSFLTAHQND